MTYAAKQPPDYQIISTAEKLLIRYSNCIAIMQYTTGEEWIELDKTRKQLEHELLTALENYK